MDCIKLQHSCLAAPGRASEGLFKEDLVKTNTLPPPPSPVPFKKQITILLCSSNTGEFSVQSFFIFSYFILAALIKEQMTFKFGKVCLKHKPTRIQVLKTFSDSATSLQPSLKKHIFKVLLKLCQFKKGMPLNTYLESLCLLLKLVIKYLRFCFLFKLWK